MTELLSAAHEFIGEGKFRGIRCSTRPDCIDREVLELLKSYGVTAIELGAQSMCDDVLEANERGHSAQDVSDASSLIHEYGFELGLQMMTGLYKSSPEKDMSTAESIISLAPDTVRIYPVVILRGTELARLYSSGVYKPMPFEDMVSLCAGIMLRFHEAGIRVIKCGLHASEFVEKDMVAGYYHPAFRELCESEIYLQKLVSMSEGCTLLRITVPYKEISRAVGHKKSNILRMKEKGVDVRIYPSVDGSTEIIERR